MIYPGTSPGLQSLPAPARRTGVTPRAAAWLLALLAMIAAGVLAASSSTTAPAPRVTTSAGRSVSGSSWAQVPPLAQLAISRALGADNHAYWATSTGPVLATKNASQRLSARYSATGVAVNTPAGHVDLSLRGVSGTSTTAVEPTAHANQVTYVRGGVSEWYANGPLGLEQGFDVARPVGAQSNTLTLTLAVGGSLRARVQTDRRGISLFAPDGKLVMRYGQLSASDNAGRALPASLSLHGRSLLISVRSSGASYPLHIDPIVQEAELSSSPGARERGMGSSVAIAGSTVVVGEPGAVVSGGAGSPSPQGAVYVFTKPAGGWANATQTAELVASDADANDSSNVYGDTLGATVAISGETIVASAPRATAGGVGGVLFAGKIYVFLKPAGGWVNSTENAQLSASDASDPDYLGSSLATDGQTVVAGEPSNSGQGTSGPGAVYVFSKPVGGWKSALQTAKLTASGGGSEDALGSSVAVSGSTIVSGAAFATVEVGGVAHTAQGALYVYSEPGSGGWKNATQSAKLTSEGVAHESMGWSVAMDGSTLVTGAPNNYNPGSAAEAAYVFSKPESGWVSTSHPLARLTPSDPLSAEHFGGSVGISGPTIVVGSQFAAFEGTSQQGATYVYAEPVKGGWVSTSAQTAKVSGSSGSIQQAQSVSVSGSSIVAGAPYATAGGHAYQGAAFVFGSAEGSSEEPKKEETKKEETTFAKPAENTKLTYTSTAPPNTQETFIGFPLNVNPGEPIACIGNVCTYAITCRHAKEACIGSATYEEIAGATASSARVKPKKKAKHRPVLYGKASFSIPAGHAGKISIKLTAAGRKLLKSKKKARGRLTITVKEAGGKTSSSSRTVTIKPAHRR